MKSPDARLSLHEHHPGERVGIDVEAEEIDAAGQVPPVEGAFVDASCLPLVDERSDLPPQRIVDL